jgi:hypothetical protein
VRWLKENIAFTLCIAGCVALSLLLLRTCEEKSDLERDLDSVVSFMETEELQSISRDSIHAEDIYLMSQNLMTEKSARILLEKEFENFKTIQSHVRTETVTRIDSFFIEYDPDSSDILADYSDYIPVDTVNKYFIQTPKGISYDDTWFAFDGSVDSIGLTIDSLSMINKFDVTIGYKKPDKPFKFLRRKQPVVELTSYNPYTKVNYVNNVVVEKQKGSIFKSRLAMFIYGGIGGYAIAKLNQ